ncbi:MAG: alpha amylase C-terminal domain-containing protein [Prolixibacteraceae bacterium]|nr:alpha amylase C-terminal domain-containing protein [Prolixibacteraceae bacterium]
MKKINLLVVLLVAFMLLGACKQQAKQSSETGVPVSTAIYPDWSEDATIYEVNIRQYTPEGTFAAFAEHLPRLKELGVEILWLMPVHPISEVNRKGTLGSYYAVADYKGINPEFGTMDEFKALVDQAHEMGFKVILDWVANHTGWDNPWIFEHPEWFTKDSLGNIIPPNADWSDIADLNFDVPEMRAAMIDALKFWVIETDIDGYRCDVAWGVPTDFWNDARAALDELKPVWMLAEDEDNKDLLIKAFNCNYSWSLHHKLNEIAQGKADISAIKNYFAAADTTFPKGSYTMQFTSNHDENSWQGTEYERMGNGALTMAALTFVLPGMPLIYSGQEAGLNKRLEFFEKDEIDWTYIEMQAFYEKLVDIKQQNQALWNGNAGAPIHFLHMSEENQLMAFTREKEGNKIAAIFNLSSEKLSNAVTCKMLDGNYTNLLNGTSFSYVQNQEFELGPWEYMILRGE